MDDKQLSFIIKGDEVLLRVKTTETDLKVTRWRHRWTMEILLVIVSPFIPQYLEFIWKVLI